MDKRPVLNKEISVRDFQEFYWLKKELCEFCKTYGLPTSGGKIELSEQIIHYLQTGQKAKIPKEKKRTPKSDFDWHDAVLTKDTVITDSYKNTQLVRQFFTNHIGTQFKFNVTFMHWIKSNEGKTLGDAIDEWHKIKTEQKSNKNPKKIAPQFEYNTYLRDFLADNPNADRETGIKLWNIKKRIRGDNIYRRSDLQLLK